MSSKNMSHPRKRDRAQPTPRERPDDTGEPAEDATSTLPARPSTSAGPEPERQIEGEAPDMGIGLDERGELDRRFEP
jgi:hypothetical protein